MKRAILIAAAVLGTTVFAAACGNGNNGNSGSNAADQQTEASAKETDTETKEQDETSTDEENAVQQTSQDGLHVMISADDRSTINESGSGTTINGSFEGISIVDDGYDRLKKSLSASDAKAEEAYDAEWEQGEAFIKDFENASGAAQDWYLNNLVVLSRCDDDVFSYTRTSDSYLGGAHPNAYVVGYNFDTDTGKELTLKDVVTDYDKVYQYVLDDLERQNSKADSEPILFDDYKETVDKLFNGTKADANDTDAKDSYTEEAKIQWFMTEDELHIIFNRYDIAPYATGQISVEIPVSSGLLSLNYFVEE